MNKDLFLEMCSSIFDEAEDENTDELAAVVIVMVSEKSDICFGLSGTLVPDDCLKIADYVDDFMNDAHELLTLTKEST